MLAGLLVIRAFIASDRARSTHSGLSTVHTTTSSSDFLACSVNPAAGQVSDAEQISSAPAGFRQLHNLISPDQVWRVRDFGFE